jgi:hypothetical protein
MLQRLDRAGSEQALQEWLLDYYIRGWAEADPVRILEATAPNYRFHDPLVGLFSRQSLAHYFEILRGTCARAGAIERCDLAFVLRGPINGSQQFWREAPRIGLTGIAQIVVGPYGVITERVAYDLNLASDLLRRA